MYLNAITYNGEKIARNSDAFLLWEAKKFKELDKHLAEINKRFLAEQGIKQPRSTNTN